MFTYSKLYASGFCDPNVIMSNIPQLPIRTAYEPSPFQKPSTYVDELLLALAVTLPAINVAAETTAAIKPARTFLSFIFLYLHCNTKQMI